MLNPSEQLGYSLLIELTEHFSEGEGAHCIPLYFAFEPKCDVKEVVV